MGRGTAYRIYLVRAESDEWVCHPIVQRDPCFGHRSRRTLDKSQQMMMQSSFTTPVTACVIKVARFNAANLKMQRTSILRPIAAATQSRSFSVARPFASAAYARLAAPRSAIAVNGGAPIASLAAAAPKFPATSFQVATFPPPGRMRGHAPAVYRWLCHQIGFSFRVCGKCSRMSPLLCAPIFCHGHAPSRSVQGAVVMKSIVSASSLSCHWASLPHTEAAGSRTHPKLGQLMLLQAFAG